VKLIVTFLGDSSKICIHNVMNLVNILLWMMLLYRLELFQIYCKVGSNWNDFCNSAHVHIHSKENYVKNDNWTKYVFTVVTAV
jgi:hypothetical protein